MRNIVLFMLISVLLTSCTSNDKTTTSNQIQLSGKVNFVDKLTTMYIYKYNSTGRETVDSFQLNPDQTYQHTFKFDEPGSYTLDAVKWQTVNFWAEDEDLEIDFRGYDTSKYKMKIPRYIKLNGGPKNKLVDQANFFNLNGYNFGIDFSQKLYKNASGDMDIYNKVMNDFYGLNYDLIDKYTMFLIDNNKDQSSVVSLLSYLSHRRYGEYLEKTIADLEILYPNYAPLEKYKENVLTKINAEKRNKLGMPAHFFKYKDIDGIAVSLDDYKGKYVLIDFWASWCGPCRSEIPNLLETYEMFKGKNIEFLSVSIDKKEKDWRKAVEEEKMPWSKILADDAGKKLMTDYNFSGIPYIVLIDDEGKFVAKNLRGKALRQKLEEIFN